MPVPPRDELVKALSYAVQGETRFGAREDTRADLTERWLKVVALLEQLPRPKGKP